ncbi:hypothetical protein ABPG77_010333 [Micractinium sp. CCAP 211/92]
MTVRRTLSMVPRSPGCTPLVQVMAGLVGGVIQLMVILTKNNLDDLIQSPLGAASPCLAVLVLLVSGMLVPLLAPRWFERHRTPLFAASRLLYFSLPTAPSPHGYSYILQTVPSHGRFSKLRDVWLFSLGTRGVALVLAPVFMPLPLLVHALVAAASMQRVSAAGEICVTPMLQHPLWQRRVHWVHLTAEMLPLVPQQQRGAAEGSTGAGSAGGGLAGGGVTDGSSLHDCRVFVAFFQAFMAALSVLLAAWLEAPRASAAAAAQAAAGAASAAAATDAPGGTRGTGWLTRSRRWLKGLVAEAEATLRQLCDMLSGRSWPGVAQLASWCLLLSFLWNLAAWLEEPLPALPGQTA